MILYDLLKISSKIKLENYFYFIRKMRSECPAQPTRAADPRGPRDTTRLRSGPLSRPTRRWLATGNHARIDDFAKETSNSFQFTIKY